MQIFLLWRHQENKPVDPQQVAGRLLRYYGPMFDQAPSCRILDGGPTRGVYLELPVRGWRPAYLQEDERGWVLGLDTPIDAAPALKAEGVAHRPGGELLAMAERFEDNPKGLLARLSPPFVLVWPERRPGAPPATWVQQDGLGLGQIFEYDDGETWAVTNRIFALKALGLRLRPNAEQWATRCALGWFPFEWTGFEKLSVLKPATRLKITAQEIVRERFEVLGDWLAAGAGLSRQDALELARIALKDYVKAANPLWSQASAGLTGGMDSRATVATLLAEKATDYYLRVRGRTDVNDVIVARYLCDLAGVPIRINADQSLPPARLEDLRRSMTYSIRWQAGHTDFHIVKHFLLGGKTMDGGNVNIMGHHGAIGRGFYIERSGALGRPVEEHEDRLINYLVKYMRPWTHPRLQEAARESIRGAIRQAELYGLSGYDKVDFFYLYERTRRWGSGGQYIQPGKVIAPFIEPRSITASYAIPAPDRLCHPFHTYIAETNIPAWAGVPDQKDLDAKTRKQFMREIDKRHRPTRWQKLAASVKKRIEASGLLVGPVAKYREGGKRSYNNKVYWQVVGEPLAREAAAAGGFWTEVFDADTSRARWEDMPDDLVILYLLEKVCEEPMP